MHSAPLRPAVVTALNLNGLAVARSLGRAGVPVYAVDVGGDGCERRSRYVRGLWQRDGELVDLLLRKADELGARPVLIPITDESVLAIAARLDDVRAKYDVAMPDPRLVRDLIDKAQMRRIAAAAGLPLPRTWEIEDVASFEAALGEMVYPCILKPSGKEDAWHAAGLRKAYVCADRDELLATWQKVVATSTRVIIQQFITGGDDGIYFTLACCGTGGKLLASFSGRKLRQWRPHCGGTAAAEPVTEPKLDEMSRRFFEGIGMRGLCSLEFKRDARDGAFYLIEPTVCRPDWQNGLADINGVPLSLMAYRDLAELPQKPTRRGGQRRWVYWAWDRQAASYYRERGELSLFGWLHSIRPPVAGAVFAIDDLGPWWSLVVERLRGLLRRFRRPARGNACA
ncbi:MAG: hypothetical protein RL398_1238 [Planctomycetota bacterium]